MSNFRDIENSNKNFWIFIPTKITTQEDDSRAFFLRSLFLSERIIK